MAGDNYWGSKGGGYPMKKPSSPAHASDSYGDTIGSPWGGRRPLPAGLSIKDWRQTLSGQWVRRDVELDPEEARQINARIKDFD